MTAISRWSREPGERYHRKTHNKILDAGGIAATVIRRNLFINIGLGSGDEGPPLALDISPKTLSRVTQLNACIGITLYPQFEEEDSHVDSH